MPLSDPAAITQLLMAWKAGDDGAIDRLFPLVYDTLSRIAGRRLQDFRSSTLSTKDLVHEAYLRLAGQTPLEATDCAHFYRIASRVMRHILIDRARRQQAQKRGHGAPEHSLSTCPVGREDRTELLLALDQALARLEAIDERKCRVVECRFLRDLTREETACTLGVSTRTVDRDWRAAKALLHLWLQEEHPADS